MAKKSQALKDAEARIIELGKEVSDMRDRILEKSINQEKEQKEAAQEATKPYKEKLLEYVQVLRVIDAVSGDSIPEWVCKQVSKLMDSTKELLETEKTDV